MGNLFGYSSFVLIMDAKDHAVLPALLDRFNSILDLIREYEIGDDKDCYWVVQIDIMEHQRTQEELCHFMFTYFSFIAMRQEHSSYILVTDKDEFKKMLGLCYGKEKKIYFLYDMLSIGDRYRAILYSNWLLDAVGGLRLEHKENGNIYSLLLDNACIYLFDPETEVTVCDETTGIMHEVDMLTGLENFKFHVAVLRQKS